jgi:hypothetical protein
MSHQRSTDSLLRVNQIVGQEEVTEEQAKANRSKGKGPRRPRSAIKPIVPVCKATWWAGVKSGRFPKPVKLGRTTCWRESEVRKLTEGGDA